MPLFLIVVCGAANFLALFHPDFHEMAVRVPVDFWTGLAFNNLLFVVGVALFVQEVRLRNEGLWND